MKRPYYQHCPRAAASRSALGDVEEGGDRDEERVGDERPVLRLDLPRELEHAVLCPVVVREEHQRPGVATAPAAGASQSVYEGWGAR